MQFLLFIPFLTKIVIDDIILNTDLSDAEKMQQLVYWLGGSIIIFFIIRPPIEYYRQYFAQHVGNKVLFDIRKELYVHLQKLSLKFYSNNRAGDIISRVINDVEATKNFVMIGLMNLWLDMTTILIVIGIMLTMDWQLTLVSIISLPLFAISVKYFFGRLRALTRKRSQALANVQSYLHERVSGISIVKSFALEEHEQKIFDKENGAVFRKIARSYKMECKIFCGC